MNYLFDIGHPAHVHLFKHLAWDLNKKGHTVFFSVRSGEKETDLLNKYGFKYRVIGKKRTSSIGKILGIFIFTFRISLFSWRHQIDLYISHGSMYAGYAAFIRRKPHIALEDSGNMEQLRFSIPVSSVILSPDVLGIDLGRKQISYQGYHELIYLNPRLFTPDQKINSLLNLTSNESYCLLRFSAWGASHDKNQKGLSFQDKKKIINHLSEKYRVFISSEGALPPEFESYEIPLSADKLHDIIASAKIVVSEGATIAAEAGVLGVPSIYINSIERCYNEDLELYGLVFNFREPKGVLEKIIEIQNIPHSQDTFLSRRQKLISEKIDVASFLVWFIETYPKSVETMCSNPSYQNRFSPLLSG